MRALIAAAVILSVVPVAGAQTIYGPTRPPALAEIANQLVGADPVQIVPLVAQTLVFHAVARDPNLGDSLIYSLDTLVGPDGQPHPLSDLHLSIQNALDANGRQVGRIFITNPVSVGVWQLTIRVQDLTLSGDISTPMSGWTIGSDSQVVFISVGTFVNRSPVFQTSPPDEIFVAEGATASFSVTAADPDPGQVVALSARQLPQGASFSSAAGNPASSTFQWTPTADQVGEFIFYIDATDNAQAAITQTRRVTIRVGNPSVTAPWIANIVPNEGRIAGGTSVTLYGQGFTNVNHVFVGGIEATKTIVNPLMMTIETPAAVDSHVSDVTVTTSDTSAEILGGFLYTDRGDITSPAAPSVSLASVSGSNCHAAALDITGEPGALVAYTVSDGAGGSVSGSGGLGQRAIDLCALADGTLTAEATLKDAAGNVSAPGGATAIKDTTVNLSLPPNIVAAATSTGGAIVTYSASSIDGAVSCSQASGSLFPVGNTTVLCTAIDGFGNEASGSFVVSVTYSWSGVLSPIEGASYKLGKVLPIRFVLGGASASVTNLGATLSMYKVSDSVTGPLIDGDSPGSANSGNQFRYDTTSGQYIFNLETKGLSAGTWVLLINLGDGVTHSVTISLR